MGLCYKLEGRGFETHEVNVFFLQFLATLGPRFYSGSNIASSSISDDLAAER
jgi:hypothetical protein